MKGQLSLQVLIYGSIAIILMTGFLVWAEANINAALRYSNKVLALTIAEAGIEYYRWHLAHAPSDFRDGTAGPGPYVHPYYDKNGNRIGEFVLDITSPLTGSSVATIKSTGRIVADPTIEKIITVKMGIPSLAKYAVALNANVRFGAGTTVYGEIHSNKGIRFDGLAYNLVNSALSFYDDPDHTGDNEFGVHTHAPPIDPLPPASVPGRPDVFTIGRRFPVPEVDFAGITQVLAQIKENASSSGFYRGPSGASGYEVILKTDNTFDLHKVNSLVSPPSNCSSSADGWGTWSVNSTSSIGNYPFPSNGLIFLEDDIWIRGQINGGRLTIASARFPDNLTTRSNITINNDILYSNYDGRDVISLIAQKNINIGLNSEDDLRADAALVAQNGRVGRYYYISSCGPSHRRSVLTTYGMIASSQRYGFAYTDGTGYTTRNLTYDANLLYGPPPGFPLTPDSYKTLSWDEIK